jgi:glutamate--cysteine ligase
MLLDSLTGLEKESLRVGNNGYISQKKHPESLGSALTNPWITTDYSEALMEFITPPLKRAYQSLDFLLDIETFVYQQLDDELLWTTSMPCIIGGESEIKIAEYGSSNAGMMKTVYRSGLAQRYGKMMQVIAGIHFNHSIAETFWPVFQEIEKNNDNPRMFINQSYMAMTRNLQRFGWLIPYLYGSSPAICKSFLSGIPKPENMESLNNNTCFERYGTSLRMGDIGYTNHQEGKTGVKANYNSLEKYTRSLREAISTPCPNYMAKGVKVNNEYIQLNANRLQIENEYYSTVRPKQILQGFEKPVDALDRRGIQYVELRSIDINTYEPAGLTRNQLFFLETFMLFSLLQDSPFINADERIEIDRNQSLVAHQGRKPALKLSRFNQDISLKNWANELLDSMTPVAELLDQAHTCIRYREAVQHAKMLIDNPDLTPSAIMLEDIFSSGDTYYEFASRKSQEHREYFLRQKLDDKVKNKFATTAQESLQQQKQMEENDVLDFDTFLERYFAGDL